MKSFIVSSFLLALTFASTGTSAQSQFEIGRVKALFVETGWTGYPAPSLNMQLQSAGGEILSKSELLVLRRRDGQAAAAVLVGSTWGGRSVRWENNCKPLESLYVHDFTKNQIGELQCARAGGPFLVDDLLKNAMAPSMRDAIDANGVSLPKIAFLVKVIMTNSFGALVSVDALLAPDFVGLEEKVPKSALSGSLPARVAAWTDALGVAAGAALLSMSGELNVPQAVFAAESLIN
jgi:hypothetical protein